MNQSFVVATPHVLPELCWRTAGSDPRPPADPRSSWSWRWRKRLPGAQKREGMLVRREELRRRYHWTIFCFMEYFDILRACWRFITVSWTSTAMPFFFSKARTLGLILSVREPVPSISISVWIGRHYSIEAIQCKNKLKLYSLDTVTILSSGELASSACMNGV